MQSASGLSSKVGFTVDAGNGVAGTYQARYLGEVIISSGSSLDGNESSVALDGYRYELSGTATMAGTGATSTIFKGIEYY
jgi:type IV pilus assembly protein PilX